MILGMSLQFGCLFSFVSVRRCVSVCIVGLAHGMHNICYEVFMVPFQIVPLILSPLVVLSCAFCMQTVSVTNIEMPSRRQKEMCRPLCMLFYFEKWMLFYRASVDVLPFFSSSAFFLRLVWKFTIFVCAVFFFFVLYIFHHRQQFVTLADFLSLSLSPVFYITWLTSTNDIFCSCTFIRWILFGARIT